LKRANLHRKWSTIPKLDWSWGYIAAVDRDGQTIFVADSHRDERLKLSIARSRNR
jgi:hypothetical protein